MIVINGTAYRGRVDAVPGGHVATRFFQVWWLPIVPLRSVWVSRRDGDTLIVHPHRWSVRSIAAAYLWSWGPIMAALCLVVSGIAGAMVVSAIAALIGWRLLWPWSCDPRAWHRAGLLRFALGTACDPLRMPRWLAASLRDGAESAFAAVSEGRTPVDVAERGACSLAQAAHAFAVLRLVAATAGGEAAAAARRASERLLDGRLALEIAATDPYRAAAMSAAEAAAPAPLLGTPVARRTIGYLKATAAMLVVSPLVLGLLVGPRLFECFCESRPAVAQGTVHKLASEAYPQWALRPGSAGRCPTMDELGEFANNNIKDPWGHDYQVRCLALPVGATSIAIWSAGENGRDEGGEGDDLASWKPRLFLVPG